MSHPMLYAKAVVGAIIAGASAAIPLVDDGLSVGDALGILVAALTALGAVWAVPNTDPDDLEF